MTLHVVILAAGQGKRMHSNLPKVLHPIAGQAMLHHVITTAFKLNPERVHVIIGHGGEQIKQHSQEYNVNWVKQEEQLGTGHAVLQALPHIEDEAKVLILSADVPLVSDETLNVLVNLKSPLNLLVAEVPNPFGFGRIVRDDSGNINAIVEEKDASDVIRLIKEIYSGICCVNAEPLKQWLPSLSNSNAQGEYYLTDIIAMAVSEGKGISSTKPQKLIEIQGANNRAQLQALERSHQLALAEELMLSGVTLADASRIDIRGHLSCKTDVFIDINSVFTGDNHVGAGCQIGPNCTLINVTLGDHVVIHANSILENCHVEEACHVGPFARLRPGTKLGKNSKVGNFVEIKNSEFGNNSKASHLSYIGDSQIGSDVNIGAGTITCNYDGAHKHQTRIEDGAFIGSGTQLVAPVTVGKRATLGAGTTLRKDAPADALTLTASTQKTLSNWQRPTKEALKEI